MVSFFAFLVRIVRAAGHGDVRVTAGIGILLGGTVSLIVALLFTFLSLPLARSLELDALDTKFAFSPSMAEESQRILQVDIDDETLKRLSQFPFPRDVYARVVRGLEELGAERIVFDVEFRQPGPPPLGKKPSDCIDRVTGLPVLHGRDLQLARSFQQAGNVILGWHLESEGGLSEDLGAFEDAFARVLREDINAGPAALAAASGLSAERLEIENVAIHQEFLDHVVREGIEKDPNVSLKTLEESLPFRGDKRDPSVAAILQNCLIRQRSLGEAKRKKVSVGGDLDRSGVWKAKGVSPPFLPFMKAACDGGITDCPHDPDGKIRRVRLYFTWEGDAFLYMGFEAALRSLETDEIGVRAVVREEGVRVERFRRKDGSVESAFLVPADDSGRTLIRWAGTPAEPRGVKTEGYVRHLRLLKVLEFYEECIEGRERHYLDLIRNLGDPSGLPDHYRAYLDVAARLERAYGWTSPDGEMEDADALRRKREELRRIIKKEMDEELKKGEGYLTREGLPDRIRKSIEEQLEIARHNRASLDSGAELESQLRPLVQGKICLIGSAATASGDLHATPLGSSIPGPDVHANIINMVLTRQFFREAPPAINFFYILFLGLLVSVPVSLLNARPALLALVGVLVLHVGIMAWTFNGAAFHLSGAGPVAAGIFSFGVVILFKEVTTRRTQRKLHRQLARHTSPEIADLVVNDPELLERPRRIHSSIFFSDVKGFTSLSEGMKPEHLVSLINRYLDRMTAALKKSRAFVDKYIGDGIMALFGVPVEDENHAVQACTAALECAVALEELNAELIRENRPILRMRTGINSGEIVAAYIGAFNRSDYTVMGDSVNLASRLESANKQYDTWIMVSESTKRLAGERFQYRELDFIRVVGKRDGVRVFELLGKAGEKPPCPSEFLEAYGEGMTCFHEGRFREATEAFQRAQELNPEDRPTQIHLGRCEAFVMNPPGEGWDGIFDLQEK